MRAGGWPCAAARGPPGGAGSPPRIGGGAGIDMGRPDGEGIARGATSRGGGPGMGRAACDFAGVGAPCGATCAGAAGGAAAGTTDAGNRPLG